MHARRLDSFCEIASIALDASVLEACDIVYVGTPPASHHELVAAALGAGKHVLLEKPVAASSADANAIVAAAEAAAGRGTHLCMNIGMRWNAALHEMRRLAIEEESLGPLEAGHLSLHFVRWPRAWQTVPWCAGRAQGGPLREVGTHFFFGLCELFGHGKARRVRAKVSYPGGPSGSKAEEAVEGEIEMAGGLTLALSVRTDGTGLASDGLGGTSCESVGQRHPIVAAPSALSSVSSPLPPRSRGVSK